MNKRLKNKNNCQNLTLIDVLLAIEQFILNFDTLRTNNLLFQLSTCRTDGGARSGEGYTRPNSKKNNGTGINQYNLKTNVKKCTEK